MAGNAAENMELLGPIAAILNGSTKDTTTKIGVLTDLAAAILAVDPQSRSPATLQTIADAMRERLVTVTKATHGWMDSKIATAPRAPAIHG